MSDEKTRGPAAPDIRPKEKDFSGQEILTPSEAAAYLKMTPRMLAERRKAGKIGHLKDGKYLAFTRNQLEEYCRSNEQSGLIRPRRGAREVLLVSLDDAAADSTISELLGKRGKR